METEVCTNCNSTIGKLETAYLFNGNVICGVCDQKLKSPNGNKQLNHEIIIKVDSLQPQPNPVKKEKNKEETLYSVHPTFIRSRPIAFALSFLLFLTIFLAWLPIVLWIYWYIQSRCSTLTITTHKTVLRKGIFSKSTTEVRHKDIRNISISQTFFNRIFNVGTIGISSAGQSGVEIEIAGIVMPEKLAKTLREFQE